MRAILATTLLAATLTGCAPRADLAEQRVRQLMAIWETGDTSRLAEIAAPDVAYDDVPNGDRYDGIDGVKSYVGHVHAWASQVKITVTQVVAGPAGATAEWVMSGVQDRPIGGRVPVATHHRFEIKGATLIELRDGRIVRAADYLDVLGFVLQLGARVELPGGVELPAHEDVPRPESEAGAEPPR